MEYDIEKLVGEMDFNSSKLQNIHQLLLTNHEIEVLEKYHIDYLKCHSLKEVLFEIEEVLREEDLDSDDLDLVSQSISERDYYQNTNK